MSYVPPQGERVLKILLYNWTPYGPEHNLGSGVSVICRNLIEHLRASHRVSYLYAGTDYAVWPRRPFVRQVKNSLHPDVPVFSLVNSTICAPAFLSSDSPERDVGEPRLDAAFRRFLDESGPFDVIHFHNLEGMTAECLKAAKESGARIVFSLHNYWAVCPQVNLWKEDRDRCDDDDGGRACVTCLPSRKLVRRSVIFAKRCHDLMVALGLSRANSSWVIVRASELARRLSLLFPQWVERLLAHLLMKRRGLPEDVIERRARVLIERRVRLLKAIHEHSDVIHSSSNRMTAIYASFGLPETKVKVSYPGTSARPTAAVRRAKAVPEGFRIVYTGKFEVEKGVAFLVDNLERMPPDELATLELYCIGRTLFRFGMERRIRALRPRLQRLEILSQVNHQELFSLLPTMHLGVVPSLWEDCMPQTVFELISCGVPVLCSDRGGASEIVRHPSFIFSPEKPEDFLDKLRAIRRESDLLQEFWRVERADVSFKTFAESLPALYGGNQLIRGATAQ